jgi:hypothetical protein
MLKRVKQPPRSSLRSTSAIRLRTEEFFMGAEGGLVVAGAKPLRATGFTISLGSRLTCLVWSV